MIRQLSLLVALAAMALGCFSSVANAANVGYTLQFGSRATPKGITLNGDQVTGFHVEVKPTSCAGGDLSEDSDAAWTIDLAAPVSLSDGKFQLSGTAPSTYYATAAQPYDADYTVSGTVSADQSLVTGTITLSDASDMAVQGCSASIPFTAIPAVALQPDGPGDSKATFQGQFVTFDYRAGVIDDLRVSANFQCGESTDTANVWSSNYGFPDIHTTSHGHWQLKAYVLDEYGDVVEFDMTGTVSGTKASGHIRIVEPPGLRGVAGDICQGNPSWTATRPTPPAPPGPEAFFNWEALRAPTGASYRYYFYVSDLSCTHGATEVQVRITGRTTTLSCNSKSGWASGPVAADRDYTAVATAVKTKNGRIIKRGTPVSQSLQMPAPGDYWRPVSGITGNPPS